MDRKAVVNTDIRTGRKWGHFDGVEYVEGQIIKCILEHGLNVHCPTIMPSEGFEDRDVGFRVTLTESEWSLVSSLIWLQQVTKLMTCLSIGVLPSFIQGPWFVLRP
jgi:hypothetical protein